MTGPVCGGPNTGCELDGENEPSFGEMVSRSQHVDHGAACPARPGPPVFASLAIFGLQANGVTADDRPFYFRCHRSREQWTLELGEPGWPPSYSAWPGPAAGAPEWLIASGEEPEDGFTHEQVVELLTAHLTRTLEPEGFALLTDIIDQAERMRDGWAGWKAGIRRQALDELYCRMGDAEKHLLPIVERQEQFGLTPEPM